MPIIGFDSLLSKLRKMQTPEKMAEKTATEWGIVVGTEAAAITPIDTSTLLNSQGRLVIPYSEGVKSKVFYGADYAIFVHDPNVKQTFRRSTAEKEFLYKGEERTRELRMSILAKNVREFLLS